MPAVRQVQRTYPEHAKLKAVQDQSQAVGEFIEWLGDSSNHGDTGAIHLAYYPFITERAVYKKAGFLEVDHYEDIPRSEWNRASRLESYAYNMQQLLARFFGIDLNKLEDEKRAMLEDMRAATNV